MIKQILEGFALGAVVGALGVKNVLFWLMIALGLFFAGIAVYGLEEQGKDLSLLYTILGYVGKFLLLYILYKMGSALVKNTKLLTVAILLIAMFSYSQYFLGHFSFFNSTLVFLSFIVPLGLIFLFDKLILKFQRNCQNSKSLS